MGLAPVLRTRIVTGELIPPLKGATGERMVHACKSVPAGGENEYEEPDAGNTADDKVIDWEAAVLIEGDAHVVEVVKLI